MSQKLQIRNFIVENFLYGQDDGFGEEVSLLEKGIIDSTGVLELVSFIEDTFAISVEDEELVPENFDSLLRLAAYVATKMSNGK
jgi:acyl carrier protein